MGMDFKSVGIMVEGTLQKIKLSLLILAHGVDSGFNLKACTFFLKKRCQKFDEVFVKR